ncbi:hypothetical protein BT67DRAFT_444196, partial [Trichocladium antarcticum]
GRYAPSYAPTAHSCALATNPAGTYNPPCPTLRFGALGFGARGFGARRFGARGFSALAFKVKLSRLATDSL